MRTAVKMSVAVDALAAISHRNGEQIALGKREIHIHHGDGMADSRLRIPAAKNGTARNMNNVRQAVGNGIGVNDGRGKCRMRCVS